MRQADYKILNAFSKTIKLHPFSLEILLKSLEFYLLVIRQQYNSKIIDSELYDEMYYDIFLLYHTILYKFAEIPKNDELYKPLDIPLYKRIDNREFIENALKRYKVS